MKQSQLLRQSETVAYEQEMAIDGDEVTVGRDVAFDLSGFDATIGDHQLVGGGHLAIQELSGLHQHMNSLVCLRLLLRSSERRG